MEVGEASWPDTEPVSQIPSVGQGGRQPDNAHGVVSVAGNEVGLKDNHFQHWATLITQQMNLINNKQPYGLREYM